jgi:hypothetical protein
MKADPFGMTNEIARVNEFVDSLDERIGTFVMMDTPSNLDDAIRRAKGVEAALLRKDNLANPRNQQTAIIVDPNLEERLKNLETIATQSYFQQSTITCNLCGRQGHKAVECRTRTINQEKNKQKICYNCNKPGHMSKECRQPRKPMTCYTCGQEGHMANKCWRNNNKPIKIDSNQFKRNTGIQVLQRPQQQGQRPVRVYYTEEIEEEEEIDPNQQLVNAVNKLTNKIQNLKA